MRSAAATRVLALFRFLCFNGLPPLFLTREASVAWETNCFSVGKRLKSGPYSLSTTSTVSTPIASICVVHLQTLSQAKQVIFSPVPAQLLGNLLFALATSSVPQLRQFLGIAFSRGDGAHNRHPRYAVQLRHRAMHAHIHLVQALLHP